MPLIFCLVDILTQFRPLFNRQNFALFCTFIVGLITHRHRATLTGIYQAVRPKVGYGSLVKFLSRGKWDADAVAKHLIKLLQERFDNWVYVYDETRAIKTGEKQFGLHFFRNHRYQKRNTNQSKFHFGHQFGALGLLCTTVTETILFPVWVKLICPKTHRDNSGSVLKRICSQIPPGLIIFDRGFNRRKVFACVLKAGHHLLCRAKSNAVFYRLADVAKGSKRGRPKKYGKRLHLPYLRYATIDIDNKRYAIASVEALTKMCPQPVRLVVIRTRPKKAKSFRYFCVYTTDLTLDLCQIVRYYRQRWLIETAFRDTKQHFGFDKYRVKSRKSINRLVQLSFLASCITQLIFNATCATGSSITVEEVCRELGIDWYRPTKLTRGLMVQYLCAFMEGRLFSQTNHKDTNSPDIQQTLDNAA
jgi:hypothetical protein